MILKARLPGDKGSYETHSGPARGSLMTFLECILERKGHFVPLCIHRTVVTYVTVLLLLSGSSEPIALHSQKELTWVVFDVIRLVKSAGMLSHVCL